MLADRQGLFKGDLCHEQRLVLTYLILRENEAKADQALQTFKERMLAAHPEFAEEIESDFRRVATGEEWADALPEDAPYQPLDASNLEAALEQMKLLGIGLDEV